MHFLRTLFWVVLAVVAVIFASNNWTQVTINLWGGLRADTKLPVLLLIAFLIGVVPTLVLHLATRWRLRRRLDSAERSLGELRALETPLPAADPAMLPPTVASASSPTALR